MMMANWGIMLVFLLLNSSARDLLDCLSSQDYWKTKNVAVSVENMTLELGVTKDANVGDASGLIKDLGSEDYATREAATKKLRAMGPGVVPQLKDKGLTASDSEVVDRARAIIASFAEGGKARQIRRLMAIRALGELKKPEAVATLKTLLDSKEPFVADYAQAAIASIEGKPRPASGPTPEQLRGDLNLLPPGLGAVAQERMEGNQAGLINAIAVQAVPANAPPGQLNRITEMMNSQVIGLAEKLGNFRLDAATFGMAKDVGNLTGFGVLVARGKYERAALVELLKDDFQVEKIKDVDVYSNPNAPNAAIIMPSDECLVIAFGGSHDALHLAELVTALQGPNDKFNQDPDLAKLVAATDTTKPVWAAIKVNDNYRQGSPFTPFDTVQLTAQRRAATVEFLFKGVGTDATAIKATVDDVNRNMADAIKELQQRQAVMPTVKGMLTFLNSIKCQATGTEATMTGTLDNAMLGAALGEFMMIREMRGPPMPAQRAPGLPPANGPQ
jgi:hypothetical protein